MYTSTYKNIMFKIIKPFRNITEQRLCSSSLKINMNCNDILFAVTELFLT
jgi:hypothetical protein